MRLVVVAALVAGTSLAIAQPGGARSRPLHEDLPPPAGMGPASPLIGATTAGRNPEAFASADKLLPAPALGPPTPAEPIFGGDALGAERGRSQPLDDATGADGTLRYVAVFNPDVMPFKRMTALDGVAADYSAVATSGETTVLAVGGATDLTRDRFWASLVIDIAPGRDVAIPSVAPDMRILSYELRPAVELTFRKDRADNFSVRAAPGAAPGRYRLVFLADADAGYFAPALPRRGYTLGEVRELAAREGLLPSLPPAVRTMGLRAASDRGLSARSRLGDAFNKLVYYFRGFAPKPLSRRTGDRFWDLYRNQAGVCRHRSLTFMITANALGIPTRLVSNEAHAFVEVWFPERGWQRIDLGGAALRLEVENAANKAIHRPRGEDPFVRPETYDQSYTQLRGEIRGLSSSQLDEARRPAAEALPSGEWDPRFTAADDVDDESTLSPVARRRDPSRLTPMVVITVVDAIGYRGERVRIEGRAGVGPLPAAGLRVDITVARRGSSGDPPISIGRGATGADGRFAIEAELPLDLELAEYDVFASTWEDARYNSAMSW